MIPVLLRARDAHCNKLNHYLRAFLVNEAIKIHFVFVLVSPLNHMELAFVFFVGLFLRPSVSHYIAVSL